MPSSQIELYSQTRTLDRLLETIELTGLQRTSYRQFHHETNTAAAALVVMAEFGVTTFDAAERGLELELHGLLQRGRYEESRGLLLRNAVNHLFNAGLRSTILNDAERTEALQQRLAQADPEFKFQFHGDLGARSGRSLSMEYDFAGDARVLLVEAQHAARRIPIHLLLARREGDTYYVMNTATGQDHPYQPAQMAAHLGSPVSAGPIAFAGLQYLYTGIAVRIAK